MSKYNIVLGGGIAGLASAYELSKKKKNVLLIEKTPKLGGIVSSTRLSTGAYIEDCYHNLFSNYTHLFELMKELKIYNLIRWQTAITGFYSGGKTYRVSRPYDLILYGGLSLKDRLHVYKFMLDIMLFLRDSLKYDDVTAKEWLTQRYGKSTYKNFFWHMLNGKFEGDADKIAASWFIERMLLRNKRNFGGERMGYIVGGFQKLINALKKGIESNGGRVILNAKATASKQKGGKITSMKINGKEYEVENVVSTVPPFELAKCVDLPHKYVKSISYPYHGTICVLVGLDRKATDCYWINMMEKDCAFKAYVEQTNWAPVEEYGMHLAYLASYPNNDSELWGLSDKALVEKYVSDFTKRFGVRKKEVKYTLLYKNRYAGLISYPGIGRKVAGTSHKTPVKNLYVTGIFNIYPESLINPAVREAKKCVSLIR